MEENSAQQIQSTEEVMSTPGTVKGKRKFKTGNVLTVLLIGAVIATLIFFQAGNKDLAFGNYKDGIYEADGMYVSPGGEEHVSVKVTIKDNIVVESEVISLAERPNSVKFQGEFVAGHKQYVVGKKLDKIRIKKVSGSSLTSQGFRDALNKIRLQAKV